jgi:hypothetical protein
MDVLTALLKGTSETSPRGELRFHTQKQRPKKSPAYGARRFYAGAFTVLIVLLVFRHACSKKRILLFNLDADLRRRHSLLNAFFSTPPLCGFIPASLPALITEATSECI